MFKKISELPETEELNDESVFPVVHDGSTKKIAYRNLLGDDYENMKNIINQLPGVSGEGESITLEPTIYAKLREIALKGNTKQETTNGYQLVDFSASKFVIGSNFNYSFENDTITMSNKTAGTYQSIYQDITDTYKSNSGKTLYLKENSYSVETPTLTPAIVLRIIYNDGTPDTNRILMNYNSGTRQTWAIPSDVSNVSEVRLYITINNTSTSGLNSLTINKPLLCTNNSYTYEPYTNGASPNPSYPQDIEVVTGNNEVVVQNKNLINYDETEVTLVKGTNRTISITPSNFPLTLEAGTYTFSLADLVMTNNNYNMTVRFVLTSGDRNLTFNNNTKTANITLTDNDRLNSLYVYLSNSDNNNATATFSKIMLEYGSTATDYTPHQEQVQTISLGDIELCKIPNTNYQDKLFHAINGNPIYDSLTSEQKALLNYGSWYKKEYVGKVVLNGSEYVLRETVQGDLYRYIVTNISDMAQTSGRIQMLSTHFRYDSVAYTEVGVCFAYWVNSGSMYFYSTETSIENFKTWLSTNRPINYYPLQVANDIEITNTTLIEQLDNLENLMSYSGQTNISSDGDLPFIISAEAFKQLS